MEASALSAVAVAAITTIGTVIVALLRSLRKENRMDHSEVQCKLGTLHDELKEVGEKIDRHIEWHLDNK